MKTAISIIAIGVIFGVLLGVYGGIRLDMLPTLIQQPQKLGETLNQINTHIKAHYGEILGLVGGFASASLVIGKLYSMARNKLTTKTTEKVGQLETQLSQSMGQTQQLTNQIDTYKTQAGTAMQSVTNLQSTITDLQNDVQTQLAQIKQLTSERDFLAKEVEGLSKKLTTVVK